MKTRSWVILALLVVIAVGVVLARRAAPDGTAADVVTLSRTPVLQSFVTASGEIVATRFADIGSAAMGRLVSLSVKEGDRVKAGQILARVDAVQASSSADAAMASVRALESESRGAANQVTAAQADVETARARATEAAKALARAKDLRQAGLLPPSDFDSAQAANDAANAQLASAQAALRRAEQARDASERRVAQGRAEGARAQDQLSKTAITAPIDGVITRLEVEEGEMVVIGIQNQPGTILMTVSDLSAINAEVKVAEADVLRLRLANPATVTLEAVPGRRYEGEVVEIGASALPQTGVQASAREFRVKVRLKGALENLRPGLTCDAEILVAERKNVLTVPLQAVVQRGGVSGVFTVRDGAARFTPVTTGVIGGLSIEVEGVAEGAAIVAGPFQVLRELKDGDRVRARATATQ
ncbi:MAG: efflux RND transporter periplasmic adaptor subunit [Vicinamibacterales bacterium]